MELQRVGHDWVTSLSLSAGLFPRGGWEEMGKKSSTLRNAREKWCWWHSLRAEKACVLCQVEPTGAGKPWSSHCSACWRSDYVEYLGGQAWGIIPAFLGASARGRRKKKNVSSDVASRGQLTWWGWLTVICTDGWPKAIPRWGCLPEAVCTGAQAGLEACPLPPLPPSKSI